MMQAWAHESPPHKPWGAGWGSPTPACACEEVALAAGHALTEPARKLSHSHVLSGGQVVSMPKSLPASPHTQAEAAGLSQAGVLERACAQVAGLTVGPEYNTHFENLYRIWVQQLAAVLPPAANIPAAYEAGSSEEQDFVQDLALFLTAFLRVCCCLPGCPLFRRCMQRLRVQSPPCQARTHRCKTGLQLGKELQIVDQHPTAVRIRVAGCCEDSPVQGFPLC